MIGDVEQRLQGMRRAMTLSKLKKGEDPVPADTAHVDKMLQRIGLIMEKATLRRERVAARILAKARRRADRKPRPRPR